MPNDDPKTSELLDQLKSVFGSASFALGALVTVKDLMQQPAERRKAAAALLRDVASLIERGKK